MIRFSIGSLFKSLIKKRKRTIIILTIAISFTFKSVDPKMMEGMLSIPNSGTETMTTDPEIDESLVSLNNDPASNSCEISDSNSCEISDDSDTLEFQKFCALIVKQFKAMELSKSIPDSSEKRLIQLIKLGQNPNTGKFDQKSMKAARRVIKLELKGRIVNLRRANDEQRKNKIVFLAEDRQSGYTICFNKHLKRIDYNPEGN